MITKKISISKTIKIIIMPCNICGELLIADPDFKLWCANCSPNHHLFSQKETYDIIETLYRQNEKAFLDRIKMVNKEHLIKIYHNQRNNPDPNFFYKFFIYSLSLGILYKDSVQDSHFTSHSLAINRNELSNLLSLSKALYINKHHLYFTRFDALRFVKHPSDKLSRVQYTENWVPIYKRQVIMGTWPSEPEIDSDLNMDLLNEFIYRKSFLNNLHSKNRKYEHISETLELLQKYHFHYPWENYLKIGWDKSEINFFLILSRKLSLYHNMNEEQYKSLNKNEVEFIKANWLTSTHKFLEFPIIIKIENEYLIPSLFFALTHQIHNIFSEYNSSKLGDYKKDLGNALEDRIFDDLQVYNLDFNSITIPKTPLLRYPNPYKRGQELFDLGMLDHNLEKFYVIECKNKVQLNLRTYNPKLLNDAIIEEFEEFRDRDLPDVETLKKDWGINTYKTVPMFYNFVPLLGEFQKFEKFQLLDGIYIISTYHEIGAILNTNFRVGKFNFYDVYSIPQKLKEIIKKRVLTGINYQHEQDIGHLLGETKEKYLLLKCKVIKVHENDYIPELWVKLQDEPNILYLDIPPEIWEDVLNLELKQDDEISVLIYRLRPYSSVIILGRIWKLN
ncbi:MAG: hypothetical protein ACFFA0_09255 [Promethearchaeota archaeon]